MLLCVLMSLKEFVRRYHVVTSVSNTVCAISAGPAGHKIFFVVK